MCKCLNIARSTYYYESAVKNDESEIENEIKKIFQENYNVYGTRKIKKELHKSNFQVSLRRIGRIMKKLGLISKYTVAQFKVHKQKCNEDPVKNETEFVYRRNFDSFSQLRYELKSYVKWFNNNRIHGSLNYMTPVEFRKLTL